MVVGSEQPELYPITDDDENDKGDDDVDFKLSEDKDEEGDEFDGTNKVDDDVDFKLSDSEDDEGDENDGNEEDCGYGDNDIYAGKFFDFISEIKLAYKTYGKETGFAVRKRTQRKNPSGVVRSFSYCCNKHGKPSVNRNPAKQNKTNRCECKAGLTARLTPDNKWEISTFHAAHNHIVSSEMSRMMPCYRHIPPDVRHRLDANDQSGIKMHKSYISVVNENGGYHNMTCTEKDCRNITKDLRELRLGKGYAEAIIRYFMNKVSHKSNEHEDFYYAIDVDEEKHLRNVFWADGWCREAYKEFGEVVTFDTTYLTNQYHMPFAPFVGTAHFRTDHSKEQASDLQLTIDSFSLNQGFILVLVDLL
ncbi:protein FAR1-RELATED SEQUENCE 5-like [Papaver somniferum]|uniref:protein FAR1-RELATED SEQUENCE 5-like n=1 Tax=Papaver somniferum TaxID=3469 RepID=UPI000E6F4AAA|nr:protein FAR1-RELATED SEQUENCE 5-like [Papaver somniferum]